MAGEELAVLFYGEVALLAASEKRGVRTLYLGEGIAARFAILFQALYQPCALSQGAEGVNAEQKREEGGDCRDEAEQGEKIDEHEKKAREGDEHRRHIGK